MTTKQLRKLKKRLKRLYKELRSLHRHTVSAMDAMTRIAQEAEPTSELKKLIKNGELIWDASEYKILSKEADGLNTVIRKVRSGKIKPDEAVDLFEADCRRIEELQACINEANLWMTVEYIPSENC